MLQEFYVNELVETCESEDLYAIMNKRIFYCKNLEMSEDQLGPADICYLVREAQSKGFLGIGGKKTSKTGGYHYVYGLDTSNVAYISAYISKYIQKISSAGNVKITQSIFCVFDYFLEKDLRILIKFPGGIRKIFYIDDQQAIEANTDEMRTVFLSSLIRSWAYNTVPIPSNSLFLEEINNIGAFNYLVESIHFLVKENAEYKYPNFRKKMDFLLDRFVKYLMNTRRFNIAIVNFSALSHVDNSLVKYVIKPLKFLQLYEDALSYLASILSNTSSSNLLNLEVEILALLKKYDDSMEIGKFVTSINPEFAENWLALADLYLKRKQYDNCLRALNNVYFLKEYSSVEINRIKTSEGVVIKETPIQKTKSSTVIQLKIIDILVNRKDQVDLIYGSSQFFLCDNADMLHDTINKILNCAYYTFDKVQKTAYNILLEMIKEINFDAFVDLNKKIFCRNGLGNESDRGSTFRSEGIQTVSSDLKISINPYLELVIDNLVEDLKIFSVVISQDDVYFNTLIAKEDIAITEVKFCIAFGILSERLKYYNTAMKFYCKADRFSFSKYVMVRQIKMYTKLKDFKNVIILLAQLLAYIPQEQFKLLNKTPMWVDKIILKTLYDFQMGEIMSWISDSSKHIIDFIKRIINKYKYWIDAGHELHLIR